MHRLAAGVRTARRSERVLNRLRLDSHDVDGLELDRWYFGDYFEDCMDSYLFTRDVVPAADVCVVVSGCSRGSALEDIGCDYEYATSLPRPGN